jgi:hypothetical protein
MWPGRRPATGVDREADVDPLPAQDLRHLEERVLRLRHRHAVAGDDDDAPGLEQRLRGLDRADLLDLALRHGAAGAGAAPSSAPNPPRMTLRNERFIALHMM